MAIDGSLKIHQIGDGFIICQSCRKIYYTIWRKSFESLLPKIFEYLNENYEQSFIQASYYSTNAVRKQISIQSVQVPSDVELYSKLLTNLDISMIAKMIYDILQTHEFTGYCLNKIEFHVLDSYKTCKIKASNYAIQVRAETLKRKLQNKQINYKLNIKCDLCRFKFIMLNIKEIPKIKLKFSKLENYDPQFFRFLQGLLDATFYKSKIKTGAPSLYSDVESDSISIPSQSLTFLYANKEEFVSEIIKLVENNENSTQKIDFPLTNEMVMYSLVSGHYAPDIPVAKRLKSNLPDVVNSKNHSPSALSIQTEYISTSDMELYQNNSPASIILKQTLNQYSNFNHPGEYHSPYDVKMTIKNIFKIFNNFKQILRDEFKISGSWWRRGNLGAQELLPIKSSVELGATLKLEIG